MNSGKLTAATSGFVLAGIMALLSTALTCAKDAFAPLEAFMSQRPVMIGAVLTNTRTAERMNPDRLIAGLIAAVVIAGLGLVLWFTLV